ncbi:glycosyltransferase family 4 protein [Luteitalea pratensis]|nr:glycosyltransferase family 4 protein [Luteitalea pratensis]
MAHGIPWFVAPSGGSRAVRGRAGTYRNAVELATAAWHVAAIHAEAVTCYPPVGLIGGLLRVPRICHVQFPPAPGELEWALRYGAEAVVTVYEHQAREIRGHVPAHIPVIPIPNGIDVEHYAAPDPSPEATAALREGASHTAVLVGHVSEVKGYPTYLRAAKLVLERFPQALFLCAGGETVGVGYTDRMRHLAAELGVSPRVRFLGPLPDVRVALRAADLFVLPSEQEGLPLAALEAMSCGRAVISTPVNGVPEAVQAGVTGLLVPPRDAEALAAAIVTLFTDASRRAEMGRQGVRRVRERFGVQRVQQRLNSLYRELTDAKAATAGGKTPC